MPPGIGSGATCARAEEHPPVGEHRLEDRHLALAVALAPVERDRHLDDARVHRRELREQLRLAGEAALADQSVAVARSMPPGASTPGRRGRTRTRSSPRARGRDARPSRPLRSAARRCALTPTIRQSASTTSAPRRTSSSICGSAPRSLVVSASSVTISASGSRRCQGGREAGPERRAGTLVDLQLDELDRKRPGVSLDERRRLVRRAVVDDEDAGARPEQVARLRQVGEEGRQVVFLVVRRDDEEELRPPHRAPSSRPPTHTISSTMLTCCPLSHASMSGRARVRSLGAG